MTVKEKLYQYCISVVSDRITRIKSEMELIQASANEETKSSAGDKYETGRAMAQREVEMSRTQLAEAEKMLDTLSQLKPGSQPDRVHIGSLVYTTQGIFFIAASIGQVELDGEKYFVVSAESPIGKLLLNTKKGDTFEWREKRNQVMNIQ